MNTANVKTPSLLNYTSHPANLALQVGLLDIDICGPSMPKMLGLEGQEIHQSNMGWSPVYVDVPEGNLGVMSIGAAACNPFKDQYKPAARIMNCSVI